MEVMVLDQQVKAIGCTTRLSMSGTAANYISHVPYWEITIYKTWSSLHKLATLRICRSAGGHAALSISQCKGK
jgi:hypothetical protein